MTNFFLACMQFEAMLKIKKIDDRCLTIMHFIFCFMLSDFSHLFFLKSFSPFFLLNENLNLFLFRI